MPDLHLVLFVDYQNVLNGAKRAFHTNPKSSDGQVDPLRLGKLIASRHVPYRSSANVILKEVRMYRGRPTRNHANYNEWHAQAGAWMHPNVLIVSRKLRGSGTKWREKGIDVSMALDFYSMAQRGDFDIGVVFTMDHDLAPTIERVCDEHSAVSIETVVWRRPTDRWAPSILGVGFRKRHRVWNHELVLADYHQVRDQTNYTLPKSRRKK